MRRIGWHVDIHKKKASRKDSLHLKAPVLKDSNNVGIFKRHPRFSRATRDSAAWPQADSLGGQDRPLSGENGGKNIQTIANVVLLETVVLQAAVAET